jgi:hypothetical protein
MLPTTDITQTNLRPVSRVHMQVGGFYKAADTSIWCCFQYNNGAYHCIRAPDNVVARFEADGRLENDNGSAESTLLEPCPIPGQRPLTILSKLDTILRQVDEIMTMCEGQALQVATLTRRISHLRSVLGKIANGKVVGDDTITTAQDALLWLADKEANPLND